MGVGVGNTSCCRGDVEGVEGRAGWGCCVAEGEGRKALMDGAEGAGVLKVPEAVG